MKRNLAILFLLIIVGSTTDDRCLGAGGAEAGELQEPPTGSAPPGDVIRPGHLGRQIGDTECIIHFYHDLIGLGLRGTRTQPRPFNTRYGLLEFVQRGQGVPNPFDAYNRAAILPIPGTASTADGTEMAIEAIEIKGIASRPVRYLLNDPGASHLGLIVRDLDKTLAVLKDERVPVITRGGNPVVLPSWPGMRGKIRAVFVRDPDGYPVELIELSPAPVTTAGPDSNVLGGHLTVVVDDLDETTRLYRNLVGPEFKFWKSPSWLEGRAYEDLTDTSGRFRLATGLIPGSPVVMEFIEYEKHNRQPVPPHFQDPGAAHILFMSKDVDLVMPRLRAAKLQTLSATDGPVFISPTTRSFFSTDPQGFWFEFMDRDVKKDPAAK